MEGRWSRAGLALGGGMVLAALAAGTAAASTVGIDGSALDVNANPGEANDITIEFTAAPNELTVRDTVGATSLDPTCREELDGQTVVCDATVLDAIHVDTGDLDDSVQIGFLGRAFYPATLNGGGGVDQLRATRWNDVLNGQAGNDTLLGGDGADQIAGQGEDDTLTGGDGNDSMNGGPGADTLNGQGTDDTMNGGFGADGFTGGPGLDTVTYADRTADVGVYSSIGPYSGNDDDGPFGQRDNIAGDVESLVGGNGNDFVWAQTNDDDLVSGRGGNDDLLAIGGPTVFSGGPGNDTARYPNRIQGVIVTIGDGPNDGNPGEGDDVQGDVENLSGSSFDDTLTGDGHDNMLEGYNGADTLSGLGGEDTVAYRSVIPTPGALPAARTIGVTVDIGSGGANDGSSDDQNGGGSRDTVAPDIEDLIGTPVSDTFIGSTSKNGLFGQGGADTLRGGNNEDTLLGEDGNDTLDGGNDADVLTGGADIDTATYAARKAAQPVTVTINALADDGGTVDDIDGAGPLTTRDHVQTTVEDVRGGQGADSLTGSGSANELIGGPGADGLFGLGGDDLLRANDGIADTAINCGAGAADESIEDPIDPVQSGCEL